MIHNYRISRCAEGLQLLKWAESKQKSKIEPRDISALRSTGPPVWSMTDIDPVAFSEQLWGFLNLQITGKPATLGRQKFDNVPSLNGLEAWRRLVVPVKSRTLAHRHALQNLVQTPPKAKDLDGV